MIKLHSIAKTVPGLSLPMHFYRGGRFLVRSFRLRKVIRNFDKLLPFAGRMEQSGFLSFGVSNKTISDLKKLAKKDNVHKEKQYSQTHLSKREANAIVEIFDLVSPEVKSYLGEGAKLDGINWMISRSSSNSISQNWHTDNVGSRLKLFLCIEGDGTQPTVILPSKNRVPDFLKWCKLILIETIRWCGYRNEFRFKGEKSLRHAEGTMFMFDTQLFHRGSYKSAKADRIIFHLEFSNPEKHKFTGGPIGTKSVNTFSFSPELLKIDSFNSLLDKRRIKKEGTFLRYSNN